jgi:mediator of RNA polymerase II transcription subunit 7
MMQAQLDRTRAETDAIRDVKEKVERMLEGLGSLKMEDARHGLEEAKHTYENHDLMLGGALDVELA